MRLCLGLLWRLYVVEPAVETFGRENLLAAGLYFVVLPMIFGWAGLLISLIALAA